MSGKDPKAPHVEGQARLLAQPMRAHLLEAAAGSVTLMECPQTLYPTCFGWM